MAETAPEDVDEADLVYRDVNDLIPYARNSRTHTDDQINAVAGSIREFGFTNPVLVREGEDGVTTIIAGHARVEAARRIGLTEVPTIDLSYLSDSQARAYVIADNRLAEMAGWDKDLLALEWQGLEDDGFELELTGFDEGARGQILADLEREAERNRREDEDDPAAVPIETDIKPGDVIRLGDHVLVCGDATDKAAVHEVLGKEKPGLMVTDPPYGVELDANWRGDHNEQPARAIIKNDDIADWERAYELFPGDIAYVWHGGLHGDIVARGLHNAGFQVRSQIIWAKNRFAMSRGDYHWQHEPCFYAVRRGKTGKFMGGRKQSTIWNIDILQRLELAHPNQKPVECMRRPILNNSNPGQLVYDPFAGTGTTIVAAELTGRMARCIELDPKFCQMIVDRYNALFVDTLAKPNKADGA